MQQNSSWPYKQIMAGSKELPFSTAVAYGDLLFISGMVGRHPQTRAIAEGDVAAQTRQTLENIQQQLELAGSSLAKVVKATVFLVEMGDFQKMNEAYRSFFPVDPPARSCVAVKSLPDSQALVEIEIIAGR